MGRLAFPAHQSPAAGECPLNKHGIFLEQTSNILAAATQNGHFPYQYDRAFAAAESCGLLRHGACNGSHPRGIRANGWHTIAVFAWKTRANGSWPAAGKCFKLMY